MMAMIQPNIMRPISAWIRTAIAEDGRVEETGEFRSASLAVPEPGPVGPAPRSGAGRCRRRARGTRDRSACRCASAPVRLRPLARLREDRLHPAPRPVSVRGEAQRRPERRAGVRQLQALGPQPARRPVPRCIDDDHPLLLSASSKKSRRSLPQKRSPLTTKNGTPKTRSPSPARARSIRELRYCS